MSIEYALAGYPDRGYEEYSEHLGFHDPEDVHPSDEDVTGVFNRLLRITPGDMQSMTDMRRDGSSDDMATILYNTRIDGITLAEWHYDMGHIKTPQARLYYAAGKLWGTQLYDELYLRKVHRHLQPDSAEAVDAYRVAVTTLKRSYDAVKQRIPSGNRWEQESLRESIQLKDAPMGQLNGLLHDRIMNFLRLELGEPDEDSPSSFYMGLVDAGIFMNAYIRWKDFHAGPRDDMMFTMRSMLPRTYTTSNEDLAYTKRLLNEKEPFISSIREVETPTRSVRSVAERWPTPTEYRHVLLGAHPTDLMPYLFGKAGIAKDVFAVLTREVPIQFAPNKFRIEREIAVATKLGAMGLENPAQAFSATATKACEHAKLRKEDGELIYDTAHHAIGAVTMAAVMGHEYGAHTHGFLLHMLEERIQALPTPLTHRI